MDILELEKMKGYKGLLPSNSHTTVNFLLCDTKKIINDRSRSSLTLPTSCKKATRLFAQHLSREITTISHVPFSVLVVDYIHYITPIIHKIVRKNK